MEIRGVGLIDIQALFGIRAVRQQKRIEVVVQLEDWDAGREYDRTGIEGQETKVLEVAMPLVTVPLNPGKNLTVICEVVAMNHLLRYGGGDSAQAFNERPIPPMAEKRQLQEDLEEGYEGAAARRDRVALGRRPGAAGGRGRHHRPPRPGRPP